MADSARARRRRASRQQQRGGGNSRRRRLVIGGAALALVLIVVAVVMFGGQQGSAADIAEVGSAAPEFAGNAGSGEAVSLTQIRADNDHVVVVFYRGHF